MNDFFNPPPVCAEINPACLRVLRETGGIEFPLQRAADGKLTPACRKNVISGLQDFLGRQSWQLRVRAICGISAHGVSLRKIPLPSGAGDLEDILRLQIEKEFPLSPDELAWGWQKISNAGGTNEAMVVAVRKEVIEDYAKLFSEAGVSAEFTLSGFARELLSPTPKIAHALLEVERNYFELAVFENGAAAGVKILPAGAGSAETIRRQSPKIIYVSGNGQKGILENLPAGIECRPLEVPGGPGVSATTIGLKKSITETMPLLWLQSKRQTAKTPFSFSFSRTDFLHGENRQWLMRAAGLLLLLLLLPFAEALLFKPLLALKLNSVKNHRQHFVSVAEPELRFLQSLKQAQPPYLDALYVMSQAAAPGLSINSLTMNQNGDVVLKATLQNAQQVMDFRSKLIASGFFANITVEDQTPNQQRVDVHMTAHWKPGAHAIVKIPAPNQMKKPDPGASSSPLAAANTTL